MKYYSICHVEFIVESKRDDFNIKDIGLILNLEPTHSHQIGDQLEFKPCAISSVWKYRLPEIQAYEVDESIEELLNLLSGKEKELSLIQSEGMDCMISIVSYKAQDEDVGLDLDIPIIETLHRLGLSFHYNVYDKQIES